MPGLSVLHNGYESLICAKSAVTISFRALRHASSQLLQNDADYEWRAPLPYERDAPPSRDALRRDAYPLRCDAGRRAYGVLLPCDDVLRLSSTCGFLQVFFAFRPLVANN
jgi:hypothetical protein